MISMSNNSQIDPQDLAQAIAQAISRTLALSGELEDSARRLEGEKIHVKQTPLAFWEEEQGDEESEKRNYLAGIVYDDLADVTILGLASSLEDETIVSEIREYIPQIRDKQIGDLRRKIEKGQEHRRIGNKVIYDKGSETAFKLTIEGREYFRSRLLDNLNLEVFRHLVAILLLPHLKEDEDW